MSEVSDRKNNPDLTDDNKTEVSQRYENGNYLRTDQQLMPPKMSFKAN